MLPPDAPVVHSFPLPLSAYPHPSPDGLLGTLADRAQIEPFNLIATGIFLLAILHTFLAARFTVLAHRMEERHEAHQRALWGSQEFYRVFSCVNGGPAQESDLFEGLR